MTYPNFIIIGASRSGTTSIHHYLKQHPDIYMCPNKSPNYFASNIDQPARENKIMLNMSKQWVSNQDDYIKLFSGATNEKAVGEVSPVYLQATGISKLIKAHNPDVKIIAILRNPIERAYTHFIGRKRDGLDNRTSFEQVIEEELSAPLPDDIAFGHYLGASRYYHFLNEYYKYFKKEQIKVYLFEDFKKNAQSILIDLYQFLEIDEYFVANTKVLYNKTGIIQNPLLRSLWTKSVNLRTLLRPYIPVTVRDLAFPFISKKIEKPTLSKDVQKKLYNIFYEDIKNLEILIEKDLSCWKLE